MRTILSVVALLTTGYLLMLGFYNVLVADDFTFLTEVETMGVWNFMVNAYNTWQCRFTYYLFDGLCYDIFGRSENLIGYTIFLLILGYLTFYRFFKDLVPHINSTTAVITSVVACNLSIMSFFDISAFYWLCTPDYFVLMYATIILFDMVFLCKLHLGLRWGLLLICAVYISGNLELYLAILIFFIGIGLLAYVIHVRSLKLCNNQIFLMLSVTLFIFIVGFLVQYFGPGTQIRVNSWHSLIEPRNYLEEFSFVPFIIDSAKAFVTLSARMAFKLHYYIIVFIMAFAFGRSCKDVFSLDSERLRKNIVIAIICFLAVYIVTIEASILSLSCLAPLRSLTFIHYLFLACLSYIGIISGASTKGGAPKFCMTVSSLVICALSVYYIATEYPAVSKYNKEMQALFSSLKDKDNQIEHNTDIIVEPVNIEYTPDAYCYFRNKVKKKVEGKDVFEELPGFFPYFPFELSIDPNDFRNKGLKRYLQLNNNLIGWDEN